jgi:hypothetical protein
MEIDVQMSRIAQAFERIADSLERIEAEGLNVTGSAITADVALSGPLCIQHEFHQDVPIGLLHVQSNERAFKVELSNCTDTEVPFAVQIND